MDASRKAQERLAKELETTRELLEESQKQETQYRALFEGIADGIIIHDPDGKILDANQVTCDRLGYSPDELRTMHLEGIVPMERRPDIGAHAKEVLADGTARFETMYLTRDGRLVPCEVMERSADYYGRTAIQSVARDISERKQTEKELARRAAQLQAVRDVGLKLTAELDLNSVLCAIASQAIDLLGGTSGGLYLYCPESDVLERVVSIGKLTMAVGNTLRRGEGLSGRIWENGKALIVDDYQSWEGRAATYECDSPVGVVGVPVCWGEEFLGVLNVSAPADLPRIFTQSDADLLGLFATQAAIAIRNARIYQQAQQEIEERKQAEAGLEVSRENERHFQERLRDLIQTTYELSRAESVSELCRRAVELGRSRLGFDRMGIWFFDKDNPEYVVGTFGTDKNGRTRDERHWRIHAPDDMKMMQQTNGVEVIYREQAMIVEEDGEELLGEKALASICDGAEPIAYIGADNLRHRQPITERDKEILVLFAAALGHLCVRQRAAEALRESEEKFRTLVEQMPDGVSLDGAGQVIFANKSFYRMLGIESEEKIVGQESLQFVCPEFRGLINKSIQKIRRHQPAPERFEVKMLRRDGVTFDAELLTRQLVIGGQPVTQVVMRDLTKQIEMEDERLRVRKLEALGVAAGGIAHDFNNILTGVIGNISLAMAVTEPGGSVFARLKDADRAAFRAKDLARELLSFARGGRPIRKRCTIGDIVKDAASFSLADSGSKCELSIAGDLWPVEADAGQISQVIHAIVVNADQSMPQGGLIKIRAENITLEDPNRLPLDPGKHIRISIQDEGLGIPEEHLHSIFDPYFTTKYKGAGLGLARAYSVVAKHDGTIHAESEVGVGSVFHIYLPACEPEAPDDRRETTAGEGRVLVMDDEELVRDAAGNMLRHLGYEVEFAETGTEAVVLYDQGMEAGKPFDAVILDLTVLHGTGAKEAIQELLHIDPDVNAIVSSGYVTDPVMSDYEDFGFKAAVAKPYEVTELSRALIGLGLGKQTEGDKGARRSPSSPSDN